MINVNCTYIDNAAWCKNKSVKRSLLGLGARCCTEYDTGKVCRSKEENTRASPPPPIRNCREIYGPGKILWKIDTSKMPVPKAEQHHQHRSCYVEVEVCPDCGEILGDLEDVRKRAKELRR